MTEKEKYKWNIVGFTLSLSLFFIVFMPIWPANFFSSGLFMFCIFAIAAIFCYFVVKIGKYKQEKKQEITTKNNSIIQDTFIYNDKII